MARLISCVPCLLLPSVRIWLCGWQPVGAGARGDGGGAGRREGLRGAAVSLQVDDGGALHRPLTP